MATRRSNTRQKPDGIEIIAAVDVEQRILGAILLNGDAIWDAIELVRRPEVFFLSKHQHIYSAMLSLVESNTPIELMSLVEALQRTGQIQEVGGSRYLAELMMLAPTTAFVEMHSRIVKERSMLRDLLQVVTDVQIECREGGVDVFDALESTEQRILAIVEDVTRGGAVSMAQAATQFAAYMAEIKDLNGGVTGIPSGYYELDAMTAGFQKGDLTILAGASSMGKTAFGVSIAYNVVRMIEEYRVPVLLFSAEMSHRQLTMRLTAMDTGISAQKIRTAKLEEHEWDRLQASIERQREWPLYIDDTAGLSITDVRARARLYKRKHNVQMIIVDYLQLFSASGAETREREISIISKGLKQIAKDLEVPVLALSQLSRKVDSRHDKRPILSDLRESGSLEQDADVVMFVYRPEYYGITAAEIEGRHYGVDNLAELIIAKQRQGPTGAFPLTYHKTLTRFESYEHDRSAPALSHNTDYAYGTTQHDPF